MTASPTAAHRQRAYRFGHLAEWLVIAVLCVKGYRILGRRVKTKWGEIDILARRGRTLAVIEVKARRRLSDALESLTTRQQQRIVNAAKASLAKRRDLSDASVRFDLMAVAWPGRWRHIKDAWRET